MLEGLSKLFISKVFSQKHSEWILIMVLQNELFTFSNDKSMIFWGEIRVKVCLWKIDLKLFLFRVLSHLFHKLLANFFQDVIVYPAQPTSHIPIVN